MPRERDDQAPQTIALIRRVAEENRLWGAERIRGELLKLGLPKGRELETPTKEKR